MVSKVVVFVFALVAAAFAQQVITQTALLEAEQQTAVVTSSAWGLAAISFDNTTMTISWNIVHNVDSPLYMHIHGPAYPGVDGGVLITLAGTAAASASPVIGSSSISAANAQYLLSGQTYVNIHTTAYPSGELRGQLHSEDQTTVICSGDEQVPPVSTTARGFALIYYENSKIYWNIVHTVAFPTAIHIHGPALENETAGVLISIATTAAAAASPVVGSADVTSTTMTALFNEMTYLNIHSQNFSNGEARGDIDPPITHAAIMTGAAAVPATNSYGRGVALFSLWADSTVVTYAMHNISATAVHVHGPAGVTASGPVIFGFDLTNDIYEAEDTLNANNTVSFQNDMTYFNVHSSAFPNGEIRGQIWAITEDEIFDTTTSTAGATTASSATTASATGGSTTSAASAIYMSVAAVFVSVLVVLL